MEIKCNSPVKQMQIMAHVTSLIKDGILKPGQRVPTYAQLSKEFRCLCGTVRTAIRMLAADGMLTRYPGYGYYVTKKEDK